MNVRNIRFLVHKDLKKLTRVPAHLFQALLFPIILTGAFGLAFGSFGGIGSEHSYTIGVVDYDGTKWAEYFIGNISDNEMFVDTLYNDREVALKDLQQGKIDALIIIPDNFGFCIETFLANISTTSGWEESEVELFVDQGSLVGINAIPPAIKQIVQLTIHGSQITSTPQPVRIGIPSEVVVEHYTQFDFMAPGMFAFAAIFLTLIVAEGFTEERMKGILRRIQLTPTSPGDVITSSILANMIITVLQISLILVISGLMGFDPQGGFIELGVAFILILLLAFCNVGFGLIAASIAKTPGAATTISFVFILPQLFLGTFMPVPKEYSQFVPSYYLTDALTSILLRGAPITSQTVLLDLVIMIGFCLVVTTLGIIIFAKYGKEKLI